MEDNLDLEKQNNEITLKVNPKMYPLEAVYSAAYVFMDKAYIVLDGDPEKEIFVKIKLKSGGDLEKIGNEFFNELLNYSDYLTRAKETKKIREIILQRAIVTNAPSILDPDGDLDSDDIDDSFLDDPEGIAIPWDEKNNECSDEEKSADKNENNIE